MLYYDYLPGGGGGHPLLYSCVVPLGHLIYILLVGLLQTNFSQTLFLNFGESIYALSNLGLSLPQQIWAYICCHIYQFL